jgi:hypothetical protein
VFAYAARLDANVPSVLLTAAAESPAASVTVDGQPLARTGRVITLDPGGTTTATVEVRAESGATARTVLRLSRAGGPVTPPGGNTGGQAFLAIDGVRLAKREAAAVAEARATIGSSARITVRYHRALAVVAQGEAPVSVRMQGATPVLDASWSSPVRVDADRAVEIAVAIPVGSSWLYYAEVRWPGDGLRVDVPFLLFARSPQVAWPAPGSPVRVAGFAGPSASPARGGTQALEVPEGVSRNDRGQFEVAVTITDAATGRVLARETGYARPGAPREDFVVFARPISLPEGATVRYALSAATKDGRGWSITGTTVVLTTTLAYDGGFEPVVLRLGEE